MTVPVKRVLLSWSSGKDSAWTLHVLRQDPTIEVVALLTTFNEAADRVAMHAVRRELVVAQADRAGLPLWQVPLPSPCSNDVYERQMRTGMAMARAEGVTHVAFGDLFLEDVRRYRENHMVGTGMDPIFPIWGRSTRELAEEMIAAGVKATLTCVDPKQIDRRLVGRSFDASLLADLPPTADPCGEKGEFHSFVHAGPMFSSPIAITVGEVVDREGFVFCDVLSQ